MEIFEEVVDIIRSQFPGKQKILLHHPNFDGNEEKYVLDALRSSEISVYGKYIHELEIAFSSFTGALDSVLVSSGTAGLHVALQLVGVQSGDEVLTQSLTFVSTANTIKYNDAFPVFVDVDEDSMGLSPESLRLFLEEFGEVRGTNCFNKSSGRRIAACLPVHVHGFIGRMDEVMNICREWRIPVVEDAAEALGSTYKGQMAGTFGDVGVFSFNGNKIITGGSGGALVTNNKAFAIQARHLIATAKSSHRWETNHDEVGYNYKMTNLVAAVLCAQMEKFESKMLNRRTLATAYQEAFKSTQYRFRAEPKHCVSNYWMMSIDVGGIETRDAMLGILNEEGIESKAIWSPMHQLPMYEKCQRDGQVNTIRLWKEVVTIPSC